jgi:hypothetical protein
MSNNKKFRNLVVVESGLRLPAQTANRVLYLDASKTLVSSTVTDLELSYLSGVSSSIQDQLDDKAEQLDLDNHINDATDAHDASAISNVPAGNLAATDVQAALNELQSDVDTRALDSAVIKKDGSVAFTAAQSMGSNKLTSLADGTDAADAVNKSQLDTKQSTSEKGQANGYASLDEAGKVPSSQLPSYVDDVLEYADLAAFPVSGETGKIYVAIDSGKTYRWSGTVYTEISPSEVNSVNSKVGVVVLDAGDINYTQIDPTDWTVADGSSIEATLDEVGSRLMSLEGGGGATYNVKVSANDTTAGYLEEKIVGASGKIAISTLNDAGDEDLQISIGSDVFDKTVDDSDDITEGSSKLFFTDERAQDAVGNILTDSSSIDLSYDDALNTISAVVLPAGVDHDALQNFVANEHVDHSSVSIETQANSGLGGGGNITASRQLIVSPMNAALVSAALGDHVLVADASDSDALKRVSVQTIVDLAGAGSAGDIAETSFSIANDQSTPANVTGLAFNNAVVRGFEVLATIEIDATQELYETFALYGINKNGSWDMSQESVGDDSGIIFSINSSGQILYISQDYAGFDSGKIKYRARTVTVG